jgi:arsenical pump membrane protein
MTPTVAVLTIFLVTCAALIALVFAKPSVMIGGKKISIFWLAPLGGALALMIGGYVSPSQIAAGLTSAGDVNPIKILLLFFSMTMMSVYLDEIGFFRLLAHKVLGRAKGSQTTLFFLLYGLVSVLTVFTSNDIIVLTFTPFICHFAKSARIDPLPYLVSEFVAANTWSMALIIGNPTNIYLMTGTGVSFLAYTARMILPTALAGLVSLGVLYLLFFKKLRAPLDPENTPAPTVDLPTEVVGLAHLGGCIILLSVSSFINLPMWLITCAFFVSLLLCTMAISFFRRRGIFLIARCIIRAPWDLAPFVISMFILVLALDQYGITSVLGGFLSTPETVGGTVASFGVSSFFAANIVNNIPMSVLYSSVVGSMEAGTLTTAALFSAVIGSNLGAFFTPTGALAGIMWTGQLHDHGVPFSFIRFVKYGATVAVPAMAAALLGLWICC